jgi:hypothetical protein
MTRRTVAVVVATLATSVRAACAEPSTAPQRSQIAPAGTSSNDLITTPCKSGWSSSEGRC